MTTPCQATYDAVREAFNGCEFAFDAGRVRDSFLEAASEMQRPSVLYRPRIAIDGNQWGVLYGENLQDGVAGFGDSPHEAMLDFDRGWYAKLEAARAAQPEVK